jgi:hypothetical protein
MSPTVGLIWAMAIDRVILRDCDIETAIDISADDPVNGRCQSARGYQKRTFEVQARKVITTRVVFGHASEVEQSLLTH